eukprot:jgi/Phyca11/113292/e_gw1.24.203.1
MRPFSITSDKYFRKYSRYLNSVCRRVKIIKPWKTRERVEVIAAELRETLKEKVAAECDYYSASSDIWTSRSKLAFICLTLHYLDTLFNMHTCDLLRLDSMSCLAHCLHLIVGSGIVKKK